MTRDDLAWTPPPGRWSIGEVLMHLAHVEEICFVRRSKAMLNEEHPALEPYNVGRVHFRRLGLRWRRPLPRWPSPRPQARHPRPSRIQHRNGRERAGDHNDLDASPWPNCSTNGPSRSRPYPPDRRNRQGAALPSRDGPFRSHYQSESVAGSADAKGVPHLSTSSCQSTPRKLGNPC